jgi:tetratricopeptide (TPR) repeat protein
MADYDTPRIDQSNRKHTISDFMRSNKKTILLLIVVFCLPVLLYMQTLGFGFIGFDDKEVITKNINFLSDAGNIPRAFLLDAFMGKNTQFYRPVQTVSYMTDIWLSGGNNLWMYHLTNVLLFGLTACLLFLLLRRFQVPAKLAVISTASYCAHPLFIPSVTWIPARGDLLLFLFSLLSFIFLMDYLQRKKTIHLVIHWLAFVIALFCKETAAILPLLFVLYYFAYAFQKRIEKKYFLNLILYAVSGILWFWMRSISTGKLVNRNDIGLTTFISNLRVIPESLARFFLPLDSTFISSFSLFSTLAGLGVIILVFIVFLINKERPVKEKAFGLVWFLLLMLPALIIKEDFIDYLTHRFFLPLIGILIFVICNIPQKWLEEKTCKKKILLNGGDVCIFALLALLTFINSRPYADSVAFYGATLSPHSRNMNDILIYTNRGSEKYLKNDFQGAIEDFTKALELNPDFALGYNDRGTVYAAQGELERAIREYNKALELFPNYVEAYSNRGKAYAEMGDHAQGLKDQNKALELNPDFVEAYNNRGTVYAARGDLDNAIKDFNKTITLNPYYADAYNNLGLARQAIGDVDRAIENYDKAIALKPGLAEAYYNRANSFSAKGDFETAIIDYGKALELNSHYAEAHNNLGLALQAKGDLESAVKHYNKAIELKPMLVEAYYNRGNYYLMKGNVASAIKEYDKAIELRPGYAEAYGIRGIAYSEKGDLDQAINDYKKAIALNPGDANAYGNLGNAYKAKGMLKEAEQSFAMYKKIAGKN